MRGWRHRVDSPQEDDSSSWLLIHQTPPCGPRLTLRPNMNNNPCHTPQLDPGVECVCHREGEEREQCVACVVVFATCCRVMPWELCVCVCVGKEGCFLGDPSSDDALLLLVKWRI